MQDRQPLIDAQTFEALLEVYEIVAGADTTDGKIERNDLAYIHGKLGTVLKMNSMPGEDPRTDLGVSDRLRQLGRGISAEARKLLP